MLEGLAGPVVMTLLGAAAFLAVIWFLLPAAGTRPCPSCGGRSDRRAARCAVCGAAMEEPQGHPDAQPYGFPEPARHASHGRPGVRFEGGAAFNRGITRRVVTLATAAMGLGIALRLAGMLGALGLPQVPLLVDGVLTIAGGLIAFVGFVFLDAA